MSINDSTIIFIIVTKQLQFLNYIQFPLYYNEIKFLFELSSDALKYTLNYDFAFSVIELADQKILRQVVLKCNYLNHNALFLHYEK